MSINLWALIAASGSGSRLSNGTAKQFLPIHGKAMLAYSLETFLDNPSIKGVMIVCKDQQAVALLAKPLASKFVASKPLEPKPVHTAAGSEIRYQSVYQGLCAIEALDDSNPIVLVHDAARPCLHRDDLQNCVQHVIAEPDQALALATRATDSIKLSAADAVGNVVEKSLARGGVWLAQTPQCARLLMLKGAIEKQEKSDSVSGSIADAATDDAWFLERAGYSVRLLQAEHANSKVTWQEDMIVAAALLAARTQDDLQL